MTANYLSKQKEDSAMASWLVKGIFWITCLAVVSYAFPSIDGDDTASHLKKIAYLDESADQETLDIRDREAVLTAIKDSEELVGLPETGELNNQTIAMMNMSTCDVKNKTGDCVRNKRSVRRGNTLLCRDPSMDTITRIKNGDTYVFKGNDYWKIHNHAASDDYPKTISADWEGLPGDLDASYTTYMGVTYFFKGSQYWRFDNKKKKKGYPKQISIHFPGIPNNVDAVLSLNMDQQIYFFKGTQYWLFDRSLEPPVQGYPQPISDKWGHVLRNGIDAAFHWQDRHAYFFKDDQYYSINTETFSVEESDDPYPRSTGPVWFDCK